MMTTVLEGAPLQVPVQRLVERLGLADACILIRSETGSLEVVTRAGAHPTRLDELAPLIGRVCERGVAELLESGDRGRALAVLPLPGTAGCLLAAAAQPGPWGSAELAALEGTAAAAAVELQRRSDALDREATDRRLHLLEQALELVPLGVTITDVNGRIVYTNPAEASMHGYRVSDLFGRSARSLAPPELWKDPNGHRQRHWMRDRTNLRRDGSRFPVRLWSDPVVEGGREVGLVTACADLSEWQAAEAELRRHEAEFRSIVEHALEFIVRFDAEGRLLYANPAAEEGLGLRTPQCQGRTLAEIAEAEQVVLPWAGALQRVLDGEAEAFGEGDLQAPGRTAWLRFRVLGEPGHAGEAGSALVFACDITEQRRRESRLIRDAERDPLTGLLNREAFLRRLELACGTDSPCAVLFLDLDRFKSVNDLLGHAAGDEVLVAVAERLRSGVRPVDVVGRLGGDEFAVLVEGAQRESDAVSVVERIQRLLEIPIQAAAQELRTSASTGIALGTPTDTPEGLLRRADRAMYRAKAIGPGHYDVLDGEMTVHEEAVLDARKDLLTALERDQLLLHYQPIISLVDGRLMALEALVRWDHPQRGLLGPQAFLPIAEQTGLIVQLDRWVLRTAGGQVADWVARGHRLEQTPVSVNFSGRHVARRDAAEFVERTVAELGIDPACLMIEVTETSVMDDREVATAALSRLRRLGIRICLDDFGTGYSSLAYLRQFPFDVLKIDRSFVQRIDASQADRAIVRSILSLARTLGLEVTAEGVETTRQRAVLRSLGCQQAQGFLIAEPLSADRAEAWLQEAR